MDKEYLEKHNIIERFVLNQLNEEELDAFLVFQMMHPDIQEEVSLMREQVKSVRTLKRKDNVIKKRNNYRWIIPAVLLSIAAIVTWFFINKKDTISTSKKTPQEEVSKTPPIKTPQEDLKSIPSTKFNIKEKNKPSEKENISIPTEKTVPKKREIAANFNPNPELELLIGNTTRSQTYQLEMSKPIANDTFYVKEDKVQIYFSGSFSEVDVDILNETFQLHLFSNDKASYQNFQPVWSTSLTLVQNKTEYRFSIETDLSLSTGLYYWLIEDEAGNTLYSIGRIFIKDK